MYRSSGKPRFAAFFNGPESFTPDDQFHIGEAPNLKNFFVACGFNSIGIQSSGVMKWLAEWITTGTPPIEMWSNDIRRTYSFQNTDKYLHDRVSENTGSAVRPSLSVPPVRIQSRCAAYDVA